MSLSRKSQDSPPPPGWLQAGSRLGLGRLWLLPPVPDEHDKQQRASGSGARLFAACYARDCIRIIQRVSFARISPLATLVQWRLPGFPLTSRVLTSARSSSRRRSESNSQLGIRVGGVVETSLERGSSTGVTGQRAGRLATLNSNHPSSSVWNHNPSSSRLRLPCWPYLVVETT